MKANIGTIDRLLRALLGIAVMSWGIYFQSWWGFIGGIIFITSVFSWCPVYAPFSWSTRKKPKQETIH